MAYLFALEDLRFAFEGREVLNIPWLSIPEGRITALTGPNGSGKTTLLHVLSSLLFPHSGRLMFRGRDITSMPPERMDAHRQIFGIVLQSPYLFRTTVEQNVAYGLASRGISRDKRFEMVFEVLDLVGLSGFGKRHCSALSGGEAQRVALARALVLRPEILLLDEPFANVDTASRSVIERVLVQENRYFNRTVIFTTHDMDQAYRLADPVITLHEGKLHEGSMENLFHGCVREDPDGHVFDTGSMTLSIPPDKGDARTASVPPETILISLSSISTSARNVHEGRIIGIRQRNGTIDITVQAGETVVARLTERSYREMGLELGSKVFLIFKAEAVRLY